MKQNIRACVVDGMSTGRLLIAELAARGVQCAHVASVDHYGGTPANELIPRELPAYYKVGDEAEDLVAEIRSWSPGFIVPGGEPGVELADQLNEALALPSRNNAATTHLRRDKYEMHERLREAGLASAAQIKTASIDSFASWIDEHGTYPVVVKPCNSACSDGVRVCDDRTEALTAFSELHGTVNLMGFVNEEIVGQELLEGTQYFVNGLSWDGAHMVTDIWRHDRRRLSGGAFLFENMILQPSEGEIESELVGYTAAVLDALDYRFGASHCEVMWTERGPVLIEANARLMGGSIDTSSFTAALGYTQAQRMAEMYLDPDTFRSFAGEKYQIKQHLAEASFIFTQSGKLAEFSRQREIEQLPSFHSFVGVPEVGEMVEKTIDTSGKPGFAYFLHEDREVVLCDSRRVLAWQREDSCFRIENDSEA